VRQGVFNVNIGDTANGYPDVLDYNLSSGNIYLQVEVSSDGVTFETLSPRQQIFSTAFSQVSGSYEQGKTFTMRVTMSSPDVAVNAASGILSFPADKLQVVSLSKTNSVLTLWVQEPTFSNSQGTIGFEGVVPNPGFSGISGNVLLVTFKVISEGPAAIKFNSGSLLANDGQATNIANELTGASYTFTAAAPGLEKIPVKIPVEVTPVVPVVSATPEVTPAIQVTETTGEHRDYMSLIAIALLLALILLCVMYLHRGFSGRKLRTSHNASDARRGIHEGFDELKETIRKELLTLEDIKTKRDMANQGNLVYERIVKHITRIEKNVAEALDDIK
jgi:hypothetical protein